MLPSERTFHARWQALWEKLEPRLVLAWDKLLRLVGIVLRALWRVSVWTWKMLKPVLRTLWTLLKCIPVVTRTSAWGEARIAVVREYAQRHIEVWRTAWEEEMRQPQVNAPRGKEIEFLPAAIEVQEAPPSPLGRTIARTIAVVFGFALLWALIGKIDIVAVAQGKIVPNDRSKVIQPLENGVIQAIHVRDGQRVQQGDPLIEIDTTSGSDRERFSNEHVAALIEVARLRALMAGRNDFDAPPGADAALVQNQRRQLRDQLSELRSLQSKAEAFRKLYDQQLASQLQYFEAEQQRAAKAQEHAAALSAAETRAISLSKELDKAQTRAHQQYLTAPISGVVQQLAVHTVGGVVTPAQQLMVIAPVEGGNLEIEAFIENKDIGFVEENQPAEIKVESFPFTRYGIIEGRVISLSRDAVPLEKVGYVYAARVSMAKSSVRVENDKDVTLTPGMTVTVEIKTGSRRLIEYFLSPLLRGAQESIRER